MKVGIFYVFNPRFPQNAYFCKRYNRLGLMNIKTFFLHKKALFCFAFALLLNACAPKTNIEKIEALEKQVRADAQALELLENKDFVNLEKDFLTCDSMLQHLRSEVVEEVFPQLQLVSAYIEQFKAVKPMMKTEIDSTLLQLGNLRADAQSKFLSDSLVTIYLADETRHVDKLNNQIQYFKDRFSSSQKDLNNIKKKK